MTDKVKLTGYSTGLLLNVYVKESDLFIAKPFYNILVKALYYKPYFGKTFILHKQKQKCNHHI